MIDLFNEIELQLEEDAVVELRGLKTSPFAEFSLATSLSTEVKLQSQSSQAVSLREW